MQLCIFPAWLGHWPFPSTDLHVYVNRKRISVHIYAWCIQFWCLQLLTPVVLLLHNPIRKEQKAKMVSKNLFIVSMIWSLTTVYAVLLTSTPGNIREILDLTWPHRARWKLIGTELGIDTGTLDAIDANNKKVEGCLNDLITGWLRNTKPRPTRAAIVAVLKSEHILSAAGNLVHHMILSITVHVYHSYVMGLHYI